MKKSLLLFMIVACLPGWAATHVDYSADKTSVFPNPERGFTDQLGGEVALTDSKNHVVQPEEEWYWDKEDENYDDRKNQSLVMLMYYLKNYKTKDLSDKILQGFDEDMQILRNHGFKCVLRFAYDWSSKNDASLQWVKRHAGQLKPYLAKNADVIYVVETGFVGQWGEWYYSANFGNETQKMNADRREVVTAMLDAVPAGRFLLVRYPLIKLSYLGDEVPLTAEQAFANTPRARIGHHNDAFLADWGNDGTYGRDGDGPDDDPVLRQYVSEETLYVPNGGETNVENSTLANTVSAMDTTIAELKRFHWSFCGAMYSEKVTDKWRANGTFAEMERRLGYRFELVSAELPAYAQTGVPVDLEIKIRNVGFAPLYNERPAYIVLRNGQTSYPLRLASDPRRWLPNEVVTTVSEKITVPDNVPEGTYDLYLHLPDACESISGDPRYAVRFANIGTWEATTGMNKLNAKVMVTKGGQGVEPISNHQSPITNKIIKDNHLLILRGEQVYTIQGQKIQ